MMMPMTTMMVMGADGHGLEETDEHKEGGMEKEGEAENAVTGGHDGTTEMNGKQSAVPLQQKANGLHVFSNN